MELFQIPDILVGLGDLKWVKADPTGDNEEKELRDQIIRGVNIKPSRVTRRLEVKIEYGQVLELH